MADPFDEVYGDVAPLASAMPISIAGSASDPFDEVFGEDGGPVSVGQASKYVGRNILAGIGDLVDMGAGVMQPGVMALPYEQRPSSQFRNLLEGVFGSPRPEDNNIAPTTATKFIGGAARGSVFPGGQVLNAMGGGGAAIGDEILPEHPVVGSLIGSVLGVGAGATTAGAANRVSRGIQKAGNAFERASVGTGTKDYLKSLRTRGLLEADETGEAVTRLKEAINEIGDTSGWGIFRDPQSLESVNTAALEASGKQIGAATAAADAIGVRPNITFPNAQKVIDAARVQKGAASEALNEFQGLFSAWDGTLTDLRKWATDVNNIAFSGTAKGSLAAPTARRLQRAIGRDLKTALDDGLQQSGVVDMKQWKEANRVYSNHATVAPIIAESVAKGESGTLATLARDLLRTSGGTLTTPTVLAGIMGGATAGPVGFAAGAGLGALTTSPTIQGLAGSVLKNVGKAGQALTGGSQNNVLNLASRVFGRSKPPPSGAGGGPSGGKPPPATGGAGPLSNGYGTNGLGSSTLTPSQVTSAAETFLPESSLAETIPSSTETVKYLPSSKYSPDISLSSVLSDSDFISHYNNTTKALPELEEFLNTYKGNGKVVAGVKDMDTAAEKIVRKVKKGIDYSASDIGDLIRGQIIVKDAAEASKVLQNMEASGQVTSVTNMMDRPNIWGYKGINSNVKTKSGAIGEVQIHTEESMAAQEATHAVYEKWRNAEDVPISVYRRSRQIAKAAEGGFVKGKASNPSDFTVGKLAEGDTFDVNYPVIEARLDGLKLSDEVPNFKAGADEKGIVEKLQGDFERRGLGPIAIWERKDGSREVISGRHRFNLAKETGQKSIPAQIYKEAEGFTAQDARRLDAELNIRSEKGTVADFARYFKNSDLTEEVAKQRGLLSRSKGKTGYLLGNSASDEVYSLHQSGKLGDSEAVAIVKAAPGDSGLQRAAIAAIDDGVAAQDIPDFIRVLKATPRAKSSQGELFGHDNSAINSGIALSKAAAKERKLLTTEINAVQNAAKNPEIAKKYDIDVKDPQGVTKRVKELKLERDKWEEWSKHPELLQKLRENLRNKDIPLGLGSATLGGLLAKTMGVKLPEDATKKDVIAAIDTDPVDATIFQMESARGTKLQNPESSAKGFFQLINKTAKTLGVKDPMDPKQNYEGYLKLRAENEKVFGAETPEEIYSAHYLGGPVFKAWKAGKSLTRTQQEQVNFLESKLLPKFRRIYKQQIAKTTGYEEA